MTRRKLAQDMYSEDDSLLCPIARDNPWNDREYASLTLGMSDDLIFRPRLSEKEARSFSHLNIFGN